MEIVNAATMTTSSAQQTRAKTFVEDRRERRRFRNQPRFGLTEWVWRDFGDEETSFIMSFLPFFNALLPLSVRLGSAGRKNGVKKMVL